VSLAGILAHIHLRERCMKFRRWGPSAHQVVLLHSRNPRSRSASYTRLSRYNFLPPVGVVIYHREMATTMTKRKHSTDEEHSDTPGPPLKRPRLGFLHDPDRVVTTSPLHNRVQELRHQKRNAESASKQVNAKTVELMKPKFATARPAAGVDDVRTSSNTSSKPKPKNKNKNQKKPVSAQTVSEDAEHQQQGQQKQRKSHGQQFDDATQNKVLTAAINLIKQAKADIRTETAAEQQRLIKKLLKDELAEKDEKFSTELQQKLIEKLEDELAKRDRKFSTELEQRDDKIDQINIAIAEIKEDAKKSATAAEETSKKLQDALKANAEAESLATEKQEEVKAASATLASQNGTLENMQAQLDSLRNHLQVLRKACLHPQSSGSQTPVHDSTQREPTKNYPSPISDGAGQTSYSNSLNESTPSTATPGPDVDGTMRWHHPFGNSQDYSFPDLSDDDMIDSKDGAVLRTKRNHAQAFGTGSRPANTTSAATMQPMTPDTPASQHSALQPPVDDRRKEFKQASADDMSSLDGEQQQRPSRMPLKSQTDLYLEQLE
jgi:hypothetical protein